jgi:hypothetical protein
LSFDLTGMEVYHRMEVPVSGSITVTLTPHTGDLDLIAVGADTFDGCDPATQCLAVDTQFGTTAETISLDTVAGQVLYFIVDGYGGAVSGYTLTVDCDKDP